MSVCIERRTILPSPKVQTWKKRFESQIEAAKHQLIAVEEELAIRPDADRAVLNLGYREEERWAQKRTAAPR